MTRPVRRFLLPVVILGVGLVVAGSLAATGPRPTTTQTTSTTELAVRVVEARKVDVPLVVDAMGKVEAFRELTIFPEVAGRVIQTSPDVVVGGRVKQGQILARVDPRDYVDALKATRAELARARLRLQEERALKRVAEYQRRGDDDVHDESRGYALRDPHVRAARAQAASARGRIARAKRDLERTLLRAPFDAIVVEENVEGGQLVGPQMPLVKLAGVERFLIKASVPVDVLRFLEIPGINAEHELGSRVRVINEAAGDGTVWEGHVLRLLGSVDDRGRMAQLVVAVDDPLRLEEDVTQRPLPLLLGTHVKAQIVGKTMTGVVTIPNAALDGTDRVWIVDHEDRLQTRIVTVTYRGHDELVVGTGLEPGDRVVVTRMSAPVEGLKVAIIPDARGEPDAPG